MNLGSVPMLVVYILLYIPTQIILFISSAILKAFGSKHETSDKVFSRVDLEHYVEDLASRIKSEQELGKDMHILRNALDFSNIKARDCMIPRTEIIAVEIDEEISDLKTLFIDKGLSVRFDSAYGQRVFMTYEDYQSKNNKWIEFINAYPRMNHIEVVITFDKFDFRLLSEVLNSEFDDFLQKITLYKWKNEHTDISMNPDSLSYKTPMKINIELKKIRE
jgi:hypothetical protein